MAPRAQTRQPSREQFVHLLLGQQIFDSAKDFGRRSGATAGPLHLRQQPIVVVALYRPLIDLDRGPQTVFHEFHQLDLVAQVFLQRALGEPITLQLGVPSLVGGTIRLHLADFGNPGSDLVGRGRLETADRSRSSS